MASYNLQQEELIKDFLFLVAMRSKSFVRSIGPVIITKHFRVIEQDAQFLVIVNKQLLHKVEIIRTWHDVQELHELEHTPPQHFEGIDLLLQTINMSLNKEFFG